MVRWKGCSWTPAGPASWRPPQTGNRETSPDLPLGRGRSCGLPYSSVTSCAPIQDSWPRFLCWLAAPFPFRFSAPCRFSVAGGACPGGRAQVRLLFLRHFRLFTWRPGPARDLCVAVCVSPKVLQDLFLFPPDLCISRSRACWPLCVRVLGSPKPWFGPPVVAPFAAPAPEPPLTPAPIPDLYGGRTHAAPISGICVACW